MPFKDNSRIYDRFTDFILHGDWERSGVSSLGRVKWNYIDHEDQSYNKTGSFKARKNFVLDIMSADDLADYCFSQPSFVKNTAIIKSELAKIGIAVASLLPLYLLESWLLHWCNHYDLQWDGSTVEENTEQEFARNLDQWNHMISGEYVLPFDFELFDHQLTTAEVIEIVRIGHKLAIDNYRGRDSDLIIFASKIVLESIAKAELSDPPGHGTNTYPVKSGLLSSMRGT